METGLLSIVLSAISLGFDLKAAISDYIRSNKKLNDLLSKSVNRAKRNVGIDFQHYLGKPFDNEILKEELLDLVQKKATNVLKDKEIPNWLGKIDFEEFYDSMMQDVGFWNYLHQQIESNQHILQLSKLVESEQLLKKIETQIETMSQHSSKLPEWLRPYEKELSVGVDKNFLDDASENLIRDGKLHLNESYINRVKQYLDEKRFCLIKAPEGRGKTYLSRIIAYDYYHNKGMEVCFLDLKYYNGISVKNIDDILQEWHKNKQKEYLLVIENVHAYNELGALRDLINGWIRTSENRVWFLLNARPTYVELDDFSDWEEQVELNPDVEDVNGIINLYSKEVRREPFANDDERNRFVEKICPNQKTVSGANLRLLKIYLETWKYHLEIEIPYISGVNEQTVIERFRNLYLINRSFEEIKTLWYISSLFQFDVPVHEDFVQDVGDLVADGLLRFEENKYHLPHSVDASFLYKAICGFKHKNVVGQMKTFATRFVEAILVSDCSKDYESEFRLLISGLCAKEEYKVVFHCFTREDMAERIINELHSGFMSYFFRPENHENPDPKALVEYYKKNIDWLKPIILGLEPSFLNPLNSVFKKRLKKYLKYDFFEDIFKDPNDLDRYLSTNYKAFQNHRLIMAISELGSVHKEILRKHYEANKNLLKPLFLGCSSTTFIFRYKTFNKQLNINIVKDIFKDPDDLDQYLSANYKVYQNDKLIMAISELGSAHKEMLKQHYEANKDLLKPLLLGCSPTQLTFIYIAFRDYLYYNIVIDIFENPKDLEKYMKDNSDKHFAQDVILKDISELGDEYKRILERYNAFNYFFYSFPKIGFHVGQGYIHNCYIGKHLFDVKRIKNNRFYLDGVSWAYIHKFVYVIKRDMTEETRKQSVDMVKSIIRIVLAKKKALSYATAVDLAFFYANVAMVDEAISRKLMEETSVRSDIKNRLAAPCYTIDDLYLFDLFFAQPWCKAILETRINHADNEQKKIINTWHDELLKKYGNEEINSGTFLDYIHQKYYPTENPPTDAPSVGEV